MEDILGSLFRSLYILVLRHFWSSMMGMVRNVAAEVGLCFSASRPLKACLFCFLAWFVLVNWSTFWFISVVTWPSFIAMILSIFLYFSLCFVSVFAVSLGHVSCF